MVVIASRSCWCIDDDGRIVLVLSMESKLVSDNETDTSLVGTALSRLALLPNEGASWSTMLKVGELAPTDSAWRQENENGDKVVLGKVMVVVQCNC